jgi:hypothetical protein
LTSVRRGNLVRGVLIAEIIVRGLVQCSFVLR